MRSHPLSRLAGAAGAAAVLLTAATPLLAQPQNDTCAAATPIVGASAPGTTAGATLEHDFSDFCQADVSDVWFTFTAPAAGPYQFSATGTDNAGLSLTLVSGCDFPMGIYGCITGTFEAAPRLEYLVFSPGETIYLRVGSLNGVAQNFTVSAGPVPPPANDECPQAVPLTLGVPLATNNHAATTSVELPMSGLCSSIAPGIAGGADVFFSFTAPFDGHYDFSTCGTFIDTVVSIHSACPVSELNAIACSDNAPVSRCGEFDSSSSYVVGVPLAAGQTYYVRVANVRPFDPFTGELGEAVSGEFTLLVQQGNPAPVPANDTCETAEEILPDSFVTGSTIHATGAPGPCGDAYGDVWDVWYNLTSTAAEPTLVEVLIFSGAFNGQATLAAYTDCGGELITCQAFNPLTNPVMKIIVGIDPGESVKLRVAGAQGLQGDFNLQVLTLGAVAPNLACDTAIPLSAGEPVVVDTNGAVSGEEGPCGQGLLDISPLWYAFTTSQAGYYRFATEAGPDAPQTSITLYTACDAAHLICSTTGDASSEFGAATTVLLGAGQSVYVRASHLYAQRGIFFLSADGPLPPPPPVANDTCAQAQAIGSMPFTASTNVTLATHDGAICHIVGWPETPTPGGIWYTYTPQVDEAFYATVTTSPDYGGSAAVFTGACGSLTQIGCPTGFGGIPTVPLSAGVTYYILASASPTNEGQDPTAVPYGTILGVDFISLPVPANDTCAGAEPITAAQTSFTVNTLAAGPDAPAPSCAGFEGLFSNAVWYTFTTETAGTLTVTGRRAPDANFEYAPAGALYSGSCGALVEVACDNPTSGWFLTDNFSFTLDLEAGERYFLAIGSWSRPAGAQTDVTLAYTGDLGAPCPTDWNGDGAVNSGDISSFLTSWIASVSAGDLAGDFNNDGATNSGDISSFLTAWIDAVTNGC